MKILCEWQIFVQQVSRQNKKSYNCPLVGSFQLAKSPLSSSPGFGKSNLNFSFWILCRAGPPLLTAGGLLTACNKKNR